MSSQGIALVTGAARGIGREVALRLADDGFDVAVNDIAYSENLDILVEEIQKKGRASSKCIADVSQDGQVKELVERVVQQHGSLDVMVANAGILGPKKMLTEVTSEEWDRMMSINARGPFLCYKYAGLQMIKQGRGGRIIGASSMAGKQGIASQGPYTASKCAVRGLTQAAALELGVHGITVNAYAPGIIDTPMLATAETEYLNALAQYKEMTPLKRVGLPQDIAGLVSFLASKESQFITGQTISVNGGLFFD
ncbi:NAD-binding protein [Mycena rosella]|uniref:NAD-binding protein n=1 Tax=Mycena rosella TaxID=1033263 RepID=A0AAD7GKN5_MYCRO|nr:NAD-binding protein [Mycena rosella]